MLKQNLPAGAVRLQRTGSLGQYQGLRQYIVRMLSVVGLTGVSNMSATLAHEWGPKVRVVTLAVGMIETEDAATFYGDENSRSAIGALLAMGRLGDPTEVADMCLVLASPLARWVTGTTVEVHGGGESPAWLSTAGDLAGNWPVDT